MPTSYQETGFIVSEDGYLLTTAHIFNQTSSDLKIKVRIGSGDKPPLDASLIKKDEALDLALLKISELGERYAAAKIGLASFQIGDKINVMGFPVDFGLTVLTGTIISNDARGRILADINVSPGTGGSPIFTHQSVI